MSKTSRLNKEKAARAKAQGQLDQPRLDKQNSKSEGQRKDDSRDKDNAKKS
jgi:hypothetical protein